MKVVIALILINSIGSGRTQNCYNPNRRPGICTSLFQCIQLFNLVTQQPISEDDRRFLVESQCQNGAGEPPYVCCNDDTGFLSGPIAESIGESGTGSGDIIPSPPTCGSIRSTNEITQIDSANGVFPWTALLVYVTDDGSNSVSCRGSLINMRYVLTAAHCVKGRVERTVGTLFAVQLGVSELNDVLPSCSESDASKCLQVGVEEVTPHELYNGETLNRYHDIALIRLSQHVPYTDFIRPICLPLTVSFTRSDPKSILRIGGWEAFPEGDSTRINPNQSVSIVNQESCQAIMSSTNVTITEWQICVGSRGAVSCPANSDGALMAFVRNSWVIEGIFSFNAMCDNNSSLPSVYTRVSGYGNWIRRHMRP